jgi:DNA polymerase-3 subunit delta
MALKPEQLAGQLSRGLAPLYLVVGSEPLLVQECRDEIIQAAHGQGFTERTVYEAGRGFDWQQLGQDSMTPSLFASRKIIDLRLPSGKPGTEGSKALIELAEAADPDVLLLVSSNRWESAMRKLKWVTVLAGAGVQVEIWPVKAAQLPGWIRGRMQRAGLQPEPEAVALLADLAEGNLLAAQQEIDKLLLLGVPPRVTAAEVARSAANSARFDAFRLVECALRGDASETLRVAAGLRRTGAAIQAVAGALYRELALADAVGAAVRAGEPESKVFGGFRIWPARQAPIRSALGRLDAVQFAESYRALSLIDRQSKGRAAGDAWQTLDRLLWFLCEPQRGGVG